MKILLKSCLLLLLALCCVAHADERILSFDSRIDIGADGSMDVRETIRVQVEGRNIRRGIYRDFPTTYRDGAGTVYRVGFRVVDVKRDGRTEPWGQEAQSNGQRVIIGRGDVLLEPGEYEYSIHYRTNRQLGFFADHDELYWNVTGNAWVFPMDVVTASVHLPVSVPAGQLVIAGYTGVIDAQGQDYVASTEEGGAVIRSTRLLQPQEGLTLVFSFPKGIIPEPTTAQRSARVVVDNRGLLIALLALMTTGMYLFVMWYRHGRDPAPGVIFPRYEAPSGFSPAAVRYMHRHGYDGKAFTAAILSLAVQGYLRIEEREGVYTLQRLGNGRYPAADEKVLITALFREKPTLVLQSAVYENIAGALSAHGKSLRNKLRSYFLRNGKYLWPSLLLAVLSFVLIVVLGVFVPLVLIVYVVVLIMHGVFALLLRAPGREGRKILDHIEGFRLFLDIAEKEELNLKHPPDKTPELFEFFLPYAVALDVEQHWAERFSAVFSGLAEQGKDWQPQWYGGAFHSHDAVQFGSSLGRSFNNALAAASMPPPGEGSGGNARTSVPGMRSGGGGGGFSGRGGGGGGGGGW